jgi:hypothetical protein
MTTMAATHSALPLNVFSQQYTDKDAFETFFDINAMDSTPSAPSPPDALQSRASSITSPASTVVGFDQGDDLQTPAKPSHEYDQYKQQTGLPSGSMIGLAGPSQGGFESAFGFDNIGIIGDSDLNGFGGMTADPSMEFDTTPSDLQTYLSPSSSQNVFDDFVDPNDILSIEEQPQSNVRFFPGMHQQKAAMAKAQAEQRKQAQQQHMMLQQRQQQQQQQQKQQATQRKQEQRQSRSHQPRKSASHITDARTEETIARVVNQIRHNSAMNSNDASSPGSGLLPHVIRMKKDEEDMDEDERLLASEEGKKLSSKERRQLRNKVSARAFRSRRKEYIGQLEEEVAGKNNECNELRNQNRALMEENARSQAFIEKLLRHPAFNPFLEDLSRDPALTESLNQPSPTSAHPSVPVTSAVSNVALQHQQIQDFSEINRAPQIGLTLIPEQPDLSHLSLNSRNDSWPASNIDFNFGAPRIFAVLDVPEQPLDIEALAGKGSCDLSRMSDSADESKADYPTFSSVPVESEAATASAEAVEEPDVSDVENDPSFALYINTPASSLKSNTATERPESFEPIFGAINVEKAFAHFELVISEERDEEDSATLRARLETLCSKAELSYQRITALTAEYDF